MNRGRNFAAFKPSPDLREAINLEDDISEYLCEGYRCDNPELARYYDELSELRNGLPSEGRLILEGAALAFWGRRIAEGVDPSPVQLFAVRHEDYMSRMSVLPEAQQLFVQEELFGRCCQLQLESTQLAPSMFAEAA